uniref:Zinc finger BED domain-containing protein RICESLEEPER 2-like n=1 Tax=Nelumbo nucifera TaxID=4432 RepID=A0A822ZAB6_NELNU|nr:TPA_asm: hypothetical protein HUJ06_014299 [Nelumbo nucifera]
MAGRMKGKYDKYWGNIEKINKLICIAAIIDSRQKLEYVEFALTDMYEGVKGEELVKKVKEVVYDLYNEYKNMISPRSGHTNDKTQFSASNETEGEQPSQVRKMLAMSPFKKYKSKNGGVDSKSELDRYVNEDTKEGNDDFDILGWWKVNCPRFSILSQMARDVLAIPISTVASESAFSIGGRVLDAFRSFLTYKIAEALLYAQDWIRSSQYAINVEEDIEELDKLENDECFFFNFLFQFSDLPKVTVTSEPIVIAD